MDRQRRMGRTLGCLVASMTFGAVVLHWGQPAHSFTYRSGTPLAALANTVKQQPWEAVRIAPKRNGLDQAERAAHFVVDRDGKWAPTDNWLGQKRLDADAVVRIGLQAEPQSNVVSASQWKTTLALIRDLRRGFNIPGRRIVTDDTLAIPPVPSPDSSTGRPNLTSDSLFP